MTKNLLSFVGVIALIAGAGYAGNGFFYPDGFRLSEASAPQLAQIYSKATFMVAQGIGLMVVAAICALLIILMRVETAPPSVVQPVPQPGVESE